MITCSLSPCDLLSLPPSRPVTLTSCHLVTLSPCPACCSPQHLVTLSPARNRLPPIMHPSGSQVPRFQDYCFSWLLFPPGYCYSWFQSSKIDCLQLLFLLVSVPPGSSWDQSGTTPSMRRPPQPHRPVARHRNRRHYLSCLLPSPTHGTETDY